MYISLKRFSNFLKQLGTFREEIVHLLGTTFSSSGLIHICCSSEYFWHFFHMWDWLKINCPCSYVFITFWTMMEFYSTEEYDVASYLLEGSVHCWFWSWEEWSRNYHPYNLNLLTVLSYHVLLVESRIIIIPRWKKHNANQTELFHPLFQNVLLLVLASVFSSFFFFKQLITWSLGLFHFLFVNKYTHMLKWPSRT